MHGVHLHQTINKLHFLQEEEPNQQLLMGEA